MLRLCNIRKKIVDKVNAIKNHRKNSGPDFYYIYNGTEKGENERKGNFKLHHLKQNQPHLPRYTHQVFPHIKFKEIEAQNQEIPD